MSSTGTSITRPYIDTAALFTQVSMRPNSRIASFAMRSTWSGSDTSAVTAMARPPRERMSSTTRWRSAALRAARTTRAPRLAACRAVTRPMPLDAPVITMTCSDKGRSGNFIGYLVADSFQDGFKHRCRAIAPHRRQRLGCRLPDDVEGALLVEDLPLRRAVLVTPEAQRGRRLADAQVAKDQFRDPRGQGRIDDQCFRGGERQQAEQRLHHQGER